MKQMIKRFIKSEFFRFSLVGGANTLLHLLVLSLLMEHVTNNAVFSNLVAFMAANVFSYTVNCKFTFITAPSIFGYAKFLSSSLLGLLLTLTISALFSYLGYHYLFAFVFIIILVPMISFAMVKVWVFKKISK